MKKTFITGYVLCSAALPLLAGDSTSPFVETPIVAATDDGWSLRAAAYGWATEFDGEMVLRDHVVPVEIGFEDIIDHIDFAFMALVEVRKDKWSLIGDFFYAKLSMETSNRFASFDSELEQFIGNFAVSYRWMETPGRYLDTYAGVRVNWVETDVGINVRIDDIFEADRNASASHSWADPVIGFRFHQKINEKYFFRALGDVGGFGVESDSTWQAMAALGYSINEKSSILLGYRAIGNDYTQSELTYDVTTHGFLIGYEMKF